MQIESGILTESQVISVMYSMRYEHVEGGSFSTQRVERGTHTSPFTRSIMQRTVVCLRPA